MTPEGPGEFQWPHHLTIRVERCSAWVFAWRVVARVLLKKKRFEVIHCDKGWIRSLLQWLRPIHGAAVVSLP